MTLRRVLVILLTAVLAVALALPADARKKRRDGPDEPKASPTITVQVVCHP
jgi:hypothetical protein